MKERTKNIINFSLIFGTLALVLLISAGDQDIGAAFHALGSIHMRWVILCILCFLGFLLFDAASIWFFLRRNECKISFAYALFVTITGQYYSNITPGASGGQPMQIYYLHKQGVPIGIGTSALVVRFFSFQFMLSVLTALFWIGNPAFLTAQVGDKMWVFLVGFIYNCVMVSGLLLLAFKKRIVGAAMKFIIRIGSKLHLVRNPESTKAKWFESLDTFHASIQMLRRRPLDFFLQLALGALQLICFMTVTYFVYVGLGLREANYGQLVTMHLAEYCAAAYTPLPGASGAQEGVFNWFFGDLFPGELLLAALLLWRFFTYYLSLIIGALTSLIYGLSTGNKSMPKTKPDNQTNP